MNTNPKNKRVLIVEDHEGLAELLAEECAETGLQTRWVTSAEQATGLLSKWDPDLVVSDLRLPGGNGLDLLKTVKSLPDPPMFLIITAFGTVSQAVEALKSGADDFLTKPLDLEHFMHRVNRVLEIRELRKALKGLRQSMNDDTFHGMYGRSRKMQTLFDQISQVAKAEGPVLILGESGVGKELVAHAIHACSDRCKGPFLAVNCAGIPESLMESEFFGHEAGAFTGARHARKGLFRDACGGTLLLDEIAEMPAALQSKLLRILQDGQVRPVGTSTEYRVNVRILAATHQDIEKAIRDGRLRQDLYYRLETFSLHIPPLRERDDDIDLLAHRFLIQFSHQMDKPITGFTEASLTYLRSYDFPGNIRELQNAIERAVAFCGESRIRPEHLPSRIRCRSTAVTDDAIPRTQLDAPAPSLSDVERHYIECVMRQVNGNKKRAADILGITRKTLYQRLARYQTGSIASTFARQ